MARVIIMVRSGKAFARMKNVEAETRQQRKKERGGGLVPALSGMDSQENLKEG